MLVAARESGPRRERLMLAICNFFTTALKWAEPRDDGVGLNHIVGCDLPEGDISNELRGNIKLRGILLLTPPSNAAERCRVKYPHPTLYAPRILNKPMNGTVTGRC